MDKLIITPKEDRMVTMTIRIDRSLQEAYNALSARTNRSRNELICLALQYALERMEVQEKSLPRHSGAENNTHTGGARHDKP